MSSRIISTAALDEWERALPASRSAFGSAAFAQISERFGGDDLDAVLLVAESGASRVAYPTLMRGVGALDLDPEVVGADIASPSFTGPIVMAGSGAECAEELNRLFRSEEVIAEFAHLHPWAADAALAGDVTPDREIVWIDLTLDPDTLWRESYSKACRKNVKRSEREGVVVRVAESAEDIAAFHRIYISTMDRNEALGHYYFSQDYFQAIHEEMAASARFVLAELDSEVIAATLYLHDDDDVYSYLGGADHAHQQVRPTNAVIHDTVAWAREQGKKRLILGGGYRPDDGIFRFKASFSPERATLELARRIHRPDEYARLAAAWTETGGDPESGFFPLYRAPVTGG